MFIWSWLTLFISFTASATTYYVNVSNAAPVSPYTTWATAATNIQSAINVSSAGDLILVGDGVYATGGSTANRVSINQAVSVQSINGPATSIIQGYQVPGTTNGASAIRCVYLANGATLSGFTLRDGATASGGLGGGILCQSTTAMVSNCVITGNSAGSGGGGFSGTYENCVISGNTSSGNGGGLCLSSPGMTVNNCLIISNSCNQSGGGVYTVGTSTFFNNCTIVGNYCGSTGGGVYGGTLTNCIVYYNAQAGSSSSGTNIVNSTAAYNCCTVPTNGLAGTNNLITPPGFVNVDAGDMHLASWSPCIDAGNGAAENSDVDLDGNPRVVGIAVDIGAYEYQEQFDHPVHFVSLSSKNPVSPYTNWMTAATNIQNAIDGAAAGDYIVVSNGVYNTGERAVYGQQENRVVIDQPVTVQGLSGARYTFIQGGIVGPRCAYLTNGAVLMGFTLTNGNTQFNGDFLTNKNGGGVWCESPAATVSNCVLVGNSAMNFGGGSYSGTLANCLITNNEAFVSGGGAVASVLNNCLLVVNKAVETGGGCYFCVLTNSILSRNSATNGGGAVFGMLYGCALTNNTAFNGGGASSNTLVNCLLSGNIATNNGGGALYCSLTNCTLYGNHATNNGGGVAWGLSYNSIFLSNSASEYGGGAFSNDLSGCSLIGNIANGGTNNYPSGGGIYGSTAISCVISNNNAGAYGGGSSSGILTGCLIISNSASSGGGCYGDVVNASVLNGNQAANGGGAIYGSLNNCIIFNNMTVPVNSGYGGGTCDSDLTNCTVISNEALNGGGVASLNYTYYTNYVNCIIVGNYSYNGSFNWYVHIPNYPYFLSCCTYPPPEFGSGNITNVPVFLDSMFHEQTNSPTIDAGSNSGVSGSTDIDGRSRIVNGAVDIGATEFQGTNIEPFISWLYQYGLPDDGSADYADSDGTGMNNWQKWIAGLNPTNPASVLAMSAPVVTNGVQGVVVSWESVTNITYFLQRSSDLTGGFTSIQSNLLGQAGTTSYIDSTATNGNSFFYRVGVQY